MLELVFLLFVCITIFVIKHLNSLGFLLEIDNSGNELKNLQCCNRSVLQSYV